MKFTRLAIPDVILVEPKILDDSRGIFYESYREETFRKNGIACTFVQDNVSRSSRGVLRGLHYQLNPAAQAKLIRVVRGEVFDVCVDIRKDSSTFGKYVSILLSEENKRMIFVPEGFAHGFCVLQDETEFIYKVSSSYSPQHERGIAWNDPALSIPWPTLDVPYILSEKDKKNPLIKSADLFV